MGLLRIVGEKKLRVSPRLVRVEVCSEHDGTAGSI